MKEQEAVQLCAAPHRCERKALACSAMLRGPVRPCELTSNPKAA